MDNNDFHQQQAYSRLPSILEEIWVQTGAAAKPAYKEKVYLITDGDEAGKFTTSADTATKVEVNAIFLGETDNGIANAEFRPGAVVKAAEK